ncbi:MAG: hypothetical protein V3V78_02125 [Candidatus Woesearchaeota archaeon]
MLLKSVKLENIRSYLNQEVNFGDGSTLLSGDIGCGKSSILLAVEFALFGIMGKRLSGESLLRNGKNEGSVELKFEVKDKEYLIKRKVKRTKDKIGQVAGYIIKEGIKKEATAVELKTEILNLIGYPKELVSKTKNLVYRYTVYTPQEEMKEILVEDAELRLDTLRKVFGIDRYKRITENCIVITRNIKDKRKELEGKVSGLEEKNKQKETAKEEIEILNKKNQELMPRLELANEEVDVNRKILAEIEVNIQEYNSLKKELELTELKERNKHQEFTNTKTELVDIDKRVEELRNELEKKEDFDIKEIDMKINSKEKEIVAVEKRVREMNNALNEFRINKKNAEIVKLKILKISKCPMCEQVVEKEHKDFIIGRENDKVYESDKGLESYSEKEREAEKKLILLKQELESLKDKISKISIIELKKKEVLEKEKRKEDLTLRQKESKREIGELYEKKNEWNLKINELKDVEKEYIKLKNGLDDALEKEKKIEIEKTAIEKEIEGINRTLAVIDQEIELKKKAKEKLRYLGELLEWLEEGFLKLNATMEKQVMLNVHAEFNELFQRWFKMLMEDETINVRLDDTFSPVIEQNGYEISIENLSGGERTSAALAYRLALNKVVNDLMEGIKTKDLIILDEPTDGFSSEQLDKVREVLEQIGAKQTIIVSHETKIESFVDNVIRVSKNEHVSEIS